MWIILYLRSPAESDQHLRAISKKSRARMADARAVARPGSHCGAPANAARRRDWLTMVNARSSGQTWCGNHPFTIGDAEWPARMPEGPNWPPKNQEDEDRGS